MPLLSVIIVARDDDYLPGYMDRLKMTVHSFIEVFQKYSIQIVLVDFNQVRHRPVSRLFNHKLITHVPFTRKNYFRTIANQIGHGAIFTSLQGNICDNRWVAENCPLPGNLAINVGLKHVTGDYVIFTSPDVIATKVGVENLIDSLAENVCLPVCCKTINHETAKNMIGQIVGHSCVQACLPRNIRNVRVGNGLFWTMPTKLAREIGGLLPYIVHRAKGNDFFLSFICSSMGCKYIIPDYHPIEITHEKKKAMNKWSYRIEKDGQILFDFEKDYGIITEWVKSHVLTPTQIRRLKFPMEHKLVNTQVDYAKKLIAIFKAFAI